MARSKQPQHAMSSDSELALLREASMASMSIGVGLTHIRRYDFAQPGFFYSGLISIATGLERLLKLILVYDYRLNNAGSFPDNRRLRACGHDISNLLAMAAEIERRHGMPFVDALKSDPIYEAIVENLSDFAIHARYYNLDYLSGQQHSGLEPLKRWDLEVCSEIVHRHYRPKRDHMVAMQHIGDIMDASSTVWFTAESGEPIDTVTDLLLREDLARVKQKYSMYYLYVLVRALCDLCAGLECKGEFRPYLREFLVIFRIRDKSKILQKKSWNPYAPYHF